MQTYARAVQDCVASSCEVAIWSKTHHGGRGSVHSAVSADHELQVLYQYGLTSRTILDAIVGVAYETMSNCTGHVVDAAGMSSGPQVRANSAARALPQTHEGDFRRPL